MLLSTLSLHEINYTFPTQSSALLRGKIAILEVTRWLPSFLINGHQAGRIIGEPGNTMAAKSQVFQIHIASG
ncbi:hypothetical protein C8R28_102235 [Nitrosomonas ureae]|uniref:Uncharacterized protein n=1 Tax=Nitrosomonas ureae TaxID=44577 RepID=A0A286AC19_9PROT|nr:hypothetical protein C8R28_102235 [Nitrosomonas ureae]SOD19452.1 hypothetical protein SAMN06297164_2450 [Nitrosomonas ureae]